MSPLGYRARRLLRAPRAAYHRRRLPADYPAYGRAILELHDYSPAMRRMIDAANANPDILTDARLDRDSVVIDIGAFIGEWAEPIERRYHPRIYAFEPSPTSFAQLEQRMGSSPSVELFNVGLGAVDKTVALHDPLGPGASIDAATAPGSGALPMEPVMVEVRDVASMFDELGLTHIDMLKVNIEGAEYDLFDRLVETGWLQRIDTISVQFHEWHPGAHRRRRRVRRALAVDHHEIWCYDWVWELWTRPRPPRGQDPTGEHPAASAATARSPRSPTRCSS